MFDFIRAHQMNIMLCLCAICASMAVMLVHTHFLSKNRKWILMGMEILATLLLFFDRLAYVYAGDPSSTGYVMVRLTNFFVFFITSAIVFCFNFYLIDLLKNEGKQSSVPRRLFFTGITSIVGMLLAIVSVFIDLYYYFDAQNFYHRGSGFLIAYIVPTVCPLVQFTAVIKNRNYFSKFIYTALLLYIFVPLAMGILQIFTYGISIVNISMVLVSIFMFFFNYLDENAAVKKAHEIEIQGFKDAQKKINAFYEEACAAYAHTIETKDDETKGRCLRTAQIARRIAQKAEMSEEDCDRIYFAAYLSDANADALACIKEHPYLGETTKYVGQRYNKDLPVYARLITVAKAYERMIHDPSIPTFYVRETFIREAGAKFDPLFAKLAFQILDEQTKAGEFIEAASQMQTELTCTDYRDSISTGIFVSQNVTDITFECSTLEADKPFSDPSIVLFDSFDAQVKNTPEEIDAHKYLEYGEVWFDAHTISNGARNIEVRNVTEHADSGRYKISCMRYEDHLLLKMYGLKKDFDVIIALPSASKAAYIGLTGENVHISNIAIHKTEQKAQEQDIPRIAQKIDYTARIKSDIPNIQMVKPLEHFTTPIEVKDKMRLHFHAQSLPDANLVWHCPYVILYSSDDKKVYGKNFHEYAMIKFDGEDNGSNRFAENSFIMKKTDSFKNWDDWKEQNKAGYECQIEFFKTGNEVTIKTQNKGISIQNTSKILDGAKDIYVTLTGDQIALTDIRVR